MKVEISSSARVEENKKGACTNLRMAKPRIARVSRFLKVSCEKEEGNYFFRARCVLRKI